MARPATGIEDTGGSSPRGDEPLVRAARAGDRGAWSRLYERNAPVIYGLLLASMPRQDAEELAQDVFLKAMDRLRDLRDDGAFGGWLCAIARNTAAARARRAGRTQLHLAEGAEVEAPSAAGHDTGDAMDGEAVLGLVRRLPEAYRETLILRLVCGLTGPQIAKATGMTEGSVRVNLCRGIAMLREALAGAREKGGVA